MAQGFTANYDLANLRLAPALESSAATGAGLSLQTGKNWFAGVGLGRGSDQQVLMVPRTMPDVMNLSGGYRWGDGQSLSLELSRGRGPGQRLGLAVNYDWPRYFVRFAYDPGLSNPVPDNLKLSAGVRF